MTEDEIAGIAAAKFTEARIATMLQWLYVWLPRLLLRQYVEHLLKDMPDAI
jgi:hypothetical protein